jgi:hypothetical protein
LPSHAASHSKNGVELAAGRQRREHQGGKEKSGGREEENDMWSPQTNKLEGELMEDILVHKKI